LPISEPMGESVVGQRDTLSRGKQPKLWPVLERV